MDELSGSDGVAWRMDEAVEEHELCPCENGDADGLAVLYSW